MLVPKILQIEISPFCNLHCFFCDIQKNNDSKAEYMKLDQFKYILNQAKGINHIIPQFWGEPTLNPDFENILSVCKSKNKIVSFFTNASNLQNRNTKHILKNTSQITISIESFTKEHYYTTRGTNLFYQVRTNIIELWREKKELSLPCKIIIRATNIFNDNTERKLFKSYWEPYCDEIVIKPLRNLKTDFLPFQIPIGYYCDKIYEHCIVKFNGDMILCCSDHFGKIVIGNVFNENILDIFNSERFNQIREKLSSLSHCKNCWYLYNYEI
jgi:radical SAM protein with 4Fe4S-binding SPASM domain